MTHIDPRPYVRPPRRTYTLDPEVHLLLLQQTLATLDEVILILQQEAQRQREQTREAVKPC